MIMDAVMKLKGRKVRILGHENYFESAVILPLCICQGEPSVLFEKRSLNLKVQPGEICFPGGRIDPRDETRQAAAVRETCEELGICRDDLEIIAPLDILVTPFNTIIYPFLAWIKEGVVLSPNPGEVESVFCIPISYLLKTKPLHLCVEVRMVPPADYPYELIPNGREYKWRKGGYDQFFYEWDGHVVWGLTARILYHFMSLLKDV